MFHLNALGIDQHQAKLDACIGDPDLGTGCEVRDLECGGGPEFDGFAGRLAICELELQQSGGIETVRALLACLAE